MKTLSYVFLISIASVLNVANATLISMDSTYGTDTVTLDTETHLTWLDVPLSTAFSYDTIQPELGIGGAFQGYRIASGAEVKTLFTNAGIPVFGNSFVSANYAPILSLMDYVGITGHNGNLGTGIPFDYTVGHIADTAPQVGWASVMVLSVYDPDNTGRASGGTVPSNNENPYHGTWLVREVSVPEPATLTLIGLGLLVLGVVRRKSMI